MSTKFLLIATFHLVFALTAARAHENQGSGEMEGTETLDTELLMTRTAAAPVDSSVELSLEAEDDNGATETKLELETRNLIPGLYSLSVTLKSTGSDVSVGTFTLGSEGELKVEFGQEGAPLPMDFNALDVSMVNLTDANGILVFTADLTNLSSIGNQTVNANVQATAGLSAPNATGNAMLSAFVSRGKARGSLQFTASGLPARLPVVIAVNGIPAKNLKTDKTGSLNVKLGPKGKNGTIVPGVGLLDIQSVAVQDQSGNVLLQAAF